MSVVGQYEPDPAVALPRTHAAGSVGAVCQTDERSLLLLPFRVVSYTAPTLAHEWNLAIAAFTPAFIATSLGAVIGYVSCGALAARFGHRLLVIASVAFFGLMSLASLWATDITSLTVLRLVTALGLGGAIPTAIALAAAHASAGTRERRATVVTVAIVVGGTIGGYVSVPR